MWTIGNKSLRAIFDDILAAFGLLTRLPLPKREIGAGNLSRGVWVYPLVGAAIGALSAVVWLFAQFAGLNSHLSAGLVLAAQILLTGALHEDGLADFADGIGGGHTKRKKLAIMHDSRIGAYGVLALILILGLRWGGIAGLPHSTMLASLVCVALLGRLAIVMQLALLPPAREDGLGTLVANPPLFSVALAFAIAVAIIFVLLPAQIAAFLLLASVVAVGIVAFLASKHIGGFTGDVLGAGEQLAQTAALLTLAMLV